VLLLAAPAAAETRPGYGGNAIVPLGSFVTTLDPGAAARPGELEIVSLVFAAPFSLDGTGHPHPRLAIALQTIDATHARLELRPGLKFDDGRPLTAADVAASLNRVSRLPAGWTLAPIRSARAVGDEVVELELSRPAPDLPLLLAGPAASVTPSGQAPAQRVVGSGAFKFVRFEKALIELVANPLCAEGRPYLDDLQLRYFANRAEEAGGYEVGKLQLSLHGASAFDGGAPKHRTAVLDGPRTLTVALAFGRGAALPDDPALRRAIAGVIDRDRLRRVTVREPSLTAVSLVAGGPPLPLLDGNRARAELDRATAGGKRLHAALLFDSSRYADREVADKLVADLADVGIDLTVDAVDARSYGERLAQGNYDLALVEAGGPAGEANQGMAALALLAAIDPKRAASLLEHAPADVPGVARVLQEHAILTPLFHRSVRAHHRADLVGLAVDGNGRVDYASAHWVR
jgi:peptide/nickel transport system substrate-binding protein